MQDLLNDTLDRGALAARFAPRRRIQIRDVFRPAFAERLVLALGNDLPWRLATFDGEKNVLLAPDKIRQMSPEQGQKLTQQVYARARNDYQYAYSSYPMLTAYLERWAPEHLLHGFFEYINGEEMLGLIRDVTGNPRLRRADAQATNYGPGSFLKFHNDGSANHGQFAFVINLTKAWSPDWGGILQFYDAEGDVEQGLTPRFNVLNLFQVPQDHAVSFVTPFAGAMRLSIVGWFRED